MNKLTSISIFRVALVFTMLVIFVGCNTNKIIPQETNYQYDNKINDLNPKYLVYHTNDSLSYLYLEIAIIHISTKLKICKQTHSIK